MMIPVPSLLKFQMDVTQYTVTMKISHVMKVVKNEPHSGAVIPSLSSATINSRKQTKKMHDLHR